MKLDKETADYVFELFTSWCDREAAEANIQDKDLLYEAFVAGIYNGNKFLFLSTEQYERHQQEKARKAAKEQLV